jgi:putative nucleotidyltransferase with HDIG domain
MNKNIKLLYVEDNHNIRDIFYKILALFFDTVEVAKDGLEGLEKYQEGEFDLILSDINMPKLNGIEMAKKIREKDLQVSIAFVSACDDREAFLQASQLDISGYLMKPLDINDLVPILNNVTRKVEFYRKIQKHETQLIEINNDLEQQMISRISEIYALNQELIETQKEVIFTMGAICESRSKETGNHVKRVACYSELLAKYYGLDQEEIKLLKEASPMHDIGKVAIPDNILNKTSLLTFLEREVMNNHALLGYEMLKHSNRPLLKMAAIIAYEHHEKYDGTGYPRGLRGKEISIYGRITALADVFDALGSDRCYKKAWKDEKIFAMINSEKEKHFDPLLVEIFFDNLDEFLQIRDKYNDY